MRSDHIPDHDRRLHLARCPECGRMYDRAAGGCDCEDGDRGMDYAPWLRLERLGKS